ncbi:unnamed protein product [Urochloa decumbens]|uniref:Uncharacterized protein n=1 Tax=Urochloa decumbens TaxID=240449 RepID=A0ABC8XWN3_9POAL
MQRLSLGSSGGRPSRVSAAAAEEEAAGAGPADEKAAKARAPAAAPDRSIHLVPVLTLLCFLVLFLLSHDPSAAALTDSPVLTAATATVTARSLDATATAGAGGCPRISSADDTPPREDFVASGCRLLTPFFLSLSLFGCLQARRRRLRRVACTGG